MKPLASIRTSKGCPYRCNFCALWKLTGGRHLKRQPEKIVEELAGIDEPFVFFADDESLVDAARMKALARLIEQAGIDKKYFLYGRSDTIAKNGDLLKMWKDIGLSRVFVGLSHSKMKTSNPSGNVPRSPTTTKQWQYFTTWKSSYTLRSSCVQNSVEKILSRFVGTVANLDCTMRALPC